MGIAHKTVSTGGLQTFCLPRVYPIAAPPFAAGCTRHIAPPDKMVSDTFLSLQRQKHPARAVRKAPEAEMLVKALGALIAGVDDQRP